jgi:transcriptional regulator with PAS, ATPase and Fis domain
MKHPTTVRREPTEGGRGGSPVFAIRWLFPVWDGRVTILGKKPIVLGRESPGFEIEAKLTSRRHAEIHLQGAIAHIEDRDSTNGVHVHGRKVKEGKLAVGTIVRLGDWVGVMISASREELEETKRTEAFQPILTDYFGGPMLQAALAPLRKAAKDDLPVIVQGETGTGKEAVANAVHKWSGRSGEFIAVNCSAFVETLAEGELFGYRAGAFTNAIRPHVGYLEAADGGTLFLDEVADLSPVLQPKLLRALQQREVLRLGEVKPKSVDLRIVVAVQAPLSEAVKAKRFREDLFGRLDGITVELPPLRRRVEDIPFLFKKLLEKAAAGKRVPSLDPALIERLCLYHWPLNIRELGLVARQVFVLHGDKEILTRSVLPPRFDNLPAPDAVKPPEREVLEAMLKEEYDGNKSRLAEALGISRQSLYRRLNGRDEVSGETAKSPPLDETPSP